MMRDTTLNEVARATPTDIAADMTHHRRTYARFVHWLPAVSIGAGAILTALFFLLYY